MISCHEQVIQKDAVKPPLSMFAVPVPNLSIAIHTGGTPMLFATEQKQFRIKDVVFYLGKKTEENFSN